MKDTVKNTDDQHESEIKRITFMALFSNLSLTALKFIVGIIGNSQAVVADAWHSCSDLSTDLLILFGVKFWTAPPDSNHPYGHSRIEAVVTVLMGCVLTAVAVRIGGHAILTLDDDHSLPNWVAIIGPVVTILIKSWLYKTTITFGERIKSAAVIANANHQMSDVLSSIPALVACTVPVIFPELVIIDHIGAVVVALFILQLAAGIMVPALMELTDIGMKESDLRAALELAKSVPGVEGVRKIRSRKMGASFFLDLTILARGDLSLNDGSVIARRVRNLLIKEGSDIGDVVVQLAAAEKLVVVTPAASGAGTPQDLQSMVGSVYKRLFPGERKAG